MAYLCRPVKNGRSGGYICMSGVFRPLQSVGPDNFLLDEAMSAVNDSGEACLHPISDEN